MLEQQGAGGFNCLRLCGDDGCRGYRNRCWSRGLLRAPQSVEKSHQNGNRETQKQQGVLVHLNSSSKIKSDHRIARQGVFTISGGPPAAVKSRSENDLKALIA